MIIKRSVLDKVNNVASRKRICDALGVADQMLYLHIRQNKNNGRLTKMDALMAISKEVGMPVNKILEETQTA